jgi:hypothetical protein
MDRMSGAENAVVVEFPLRGEWRATSTSAQQIPSHGTNFFAQRYAYDFVRMDSSGNWFLSSIGKCTSAPFYIGYSGGKVLCLEAALFTVHSPVQWSRWATIGPIEDGCPCLGSSFAAVLREA